MHFLLTWFGSQSPDAVWCAGRTVPYLNVCMQITPPYLAVPAPYSRNRGGGYETYHEVSERDPWSPGQESRIAYGCYERHVREICMSCIALHTESSGEQDELML
jgi:hypothetical protein